MPGERRNIELKTRDEDPAGTLARALALPGVEDRGVLVQRDTYFATARGRLKLREETRPDGTAAPALLIPYVRADAAEARASDYRLVEIADPAALVAGLADTLGVTVVVAKRRRLLLTDGVRIHLDEVEGLGSFAELEAVVAEGSDGSAEHAAVARLVNALGLGPVVPEGYAQLLAQAADGYAAARP